MKAQGEGRFGVARAGRVLRPPLCLLCCALLALASACAKRVAPALPKTLAYPDFVAPAVPETMRGLPEAELVDAGWRYLQNDLPRSAEREFAEALKRRPMFFPATTGQGYMALAQKDAKRALASFDSALSAERAYAPALVGRGQALLALGREADALSSLEAALAADSSLTDVRRRVEVLRFRNTQELIEAARKAAASGRLADARLAYERALAATPDSAFLHHELGTIEQRQGNTDSALQHLRRASELDPSDASTLVQIGELLETRSDFAGAEAAYRKAASLDPEVMPPARVAAVAEKARDGALPPEFRAIPASPQITRGDLAALIGVRLESMLRDVRGQDVVLTDVRGHWASPWITPVARAGVIEPFENHTFQPRTRIRRGELAESVTRLLTLIAASDPSLRERLARRPAITDLSPGHLRYPAAATAVASGVMPLLEGDRFQVARPVSGAEAVEVVARVRALADQRQALNP